MVKRYLSILVLLVFLFAFSGQALGAGTFDITSMENNLVKVQTSADLKGKRIMVEKGGDKYYYSFHNKTETIPLQLGKGTYTVKILENTSGNKYKVLDKKDITVSSDDNKNIYLTSNQPVYWEGKDKVLELAKSLTKDNKTDSEKVKSIYDYIVKNIKYDYNKIKGLNEDYVPDIEKVLSAQSGICYDYSSLFAGMLRSLGIPTKLVKGYRNDLKEYHAWNEVFIEGKWALVDTTYDAALNNTNKKISMIKDSKEYNSLRTY